MIRQSSATWRGTGKDGIGALTSGSGVLSSTNFGYKSRFENGPGTNPEELLAAAHAGCFTMALAFGLQLAGFEATELNTDAAVSLDPDGKQGFKIGRSALTVRARVTGIADPLFQKIAREAELNCPISKVLNTEIKMTATLES